MTECAEISPKMRVAVLGSTGFIGSEVCCVLSKHCHLESFGYGCSIPISRKYDVVINCAGMSYRFLVQKYSQRCRYVEDDILRKLSLFHCSRVIHISSMLAESDCEYGKLKKYVENEIKSSFEQWCILRLSGVIGPEFRKNVVFDILHDRKVYVTESSVLNYIAAYEVGYLILAMLKKEMWGKVINVAATQNITAGWIARIFRKPDIRWGKEHQDSGDIDISVMKAILNSKTSEVYIREVLGYYK